MAVILKLGKKFQVTYEVVTPAKEIKMIKELFDNYEDAVKRKALLDGETCMFSPDSLFVDVMKDWLILIFKNALMLILILMQAIYLLLLLRLLMK